jgi:hypothetical protein
LLHQLGLILHFITLYALCFCSCSNKHFTILSATSTQIQSGINGGGKTIEYFFKLKINTDKLIIFDSVWVNNKVYPTYLASRSITISQEPVTFKNHDTIMVRVSQISQVNSIKIKPPIKNNAEAILMYYLLGKKQYYKINKIFKEQNIYHP